MSNIFNNNKKEIEQKARLRKKKKKKKIYIQTHVYMDMTHDRDAAAIQWVLKNDAGPIRDTYGKKINLDFYLIQKSIVGES